MVNLIDKTYFFGRMALPFSSADEITAFFVDYPAFQIRTLKDALGEHLYQLFEDDFTGSSPVTQKYKDLLNGKVYTIDYDGDFNIKYSGIINSTNKISFLAYFYFYEKFKSNARLSKTGWIDENNQNSNVIDSHAVIEIYNKGVDLYGEVEKRISNFSKELFDLNKNNYVNGLPYFGNTVGGNIITSNKLTGSLLNYMHQMNSDESEYYPKWIYTPKGEINSFNI